VFRENPQELLDGANGGAFTKMMWAVVLPPYVRHEPLAPAVPPLPIAAHSP